MAFQSKTSQKKNWASKTKKTSNASVSRSSTSSADQKYYTSQANGKKQYAEWVNGLSLTTRTKPWTTRTWNLSGTSSKNCTKMDTSKKENAFSCSAHTAQHHSQTQKSQWTTATATSQKKQQQQNSSSPNTKTHSYLHGLQH